MTYTWLAVQTRIDAACDEPKSVFSLIKMIFSCYVIITCFSIAGALHVQTLSRHTDKQFSWVSQPFNVNLSNTQQSTFADDIIPPLDINSHDDILSAPISPHVQDACSDASSRMLVMGYYPDWAYPAFPPENIDFNRYDWIDFAFMSLNADFALVWDDTDVGPKLLERLVAAAHMGGSKVKLSIGGWSGSQ